MCVHFLHALHNRLESSGISRAWFARLFISWDIALCALVSQRGRIVHLVVQWIENVTTIAGTMIGVRVRRLETYLRCRLNERLTRRTFTSSHMKCRVNRFIYIFVAHMKFRSQLRRVFFKSMERGIAISTLLLLWWISFIFLFYVASFGCLHASLHSVITTNTLFCGQHQANPLISRRKKKSLKETDPLFVLTHLFWCFIACRWCVEHRRRQPFGAKMSFCPVRW